MELTKIKEEVLQISNNKNKIHALFPELIDIDIEGMKYAYCIYIEKPLLLIAGYLTSSYIDKKRDFKEYIKKHRPRNFIGLVFLLDVYPGLYQINVLDPEDYQFTYLPIVDDILKESKGILLWHYQLENLFRLFYYRGEQVTILRNNINMRKDEAFNIAKRLKINRETSFYDIISNRMILYHTRQPNIKGAYNLHKAVNFTW